MSTSFSQPSSSQFFRALSKLGVPRQGIKAALVWRSSGRRFSTARIGGQQLTMQRSFRFATHLAGNCVFITLPGSASGASW